MLEFHPPERSTSSTQAINLFFALMPDAAAAAAAHKVARQHSVDRRMTGRPLAMDRLHITLLPAGSFIGTVPRAFMDLALSIGDAVTLPSFRVTLNRAVSFARKTGKRPYVLLGGEGVADVMPLHCALVGAMFRAGLDIPVRSSFSPHQTLLYDHRHHAEMPIEPISWEAREFVLIESRVGQTRHIHHGRWSLR